MPLVTLRFIREHGVSSRLIQWDTWGKWSHVDFVTNNGYLGSRIKGGVKIRPFDYVEPAEALYAHVEVTDEQEKHLIMWLNQQIGKPYDWSAIFGFVVHHDWQDPNKWFCSELVMGAFESINIKLLNTESIYRISPNLLELSPLIIPTGQKI